MHYHLSCTRITLALVVLASPASALDAARQDIYFERALAAARQLGRDGPQRTAIEVALVKASSGRHEEAIQVFNQSAATPPAQAKSFRDLASILASQGKIEEAGAWFQRAKKLTTERVHSNDRTGHLLDIAKAQSDAGLFDDALNTARSISVLAAHAQALLHIVEGQTKAGLLEAAKLSAAENKLPQAATHFQVALAAGHAYSGRFVEAQSLADQLRPPKAKAMALREIARAMAQAGHFEDAHTLAKTISEYAERNEVATFYAQLGETERSRALFAENLAQIETVSTDSSRDASYRNVADAQIRAGFFEDAHKSIARIDFSYISSPAYRQLAAAEIRAGRADSVEAWIASLDSDRAKDISDSWLGAAEGLIP